MKVAAKRPLEEKATHGTTLLPVSIYRSDCPKGTETIFYLHWHREFEFFIVLKGTVLFTVEDREYQVKCKEGIFVNSNLLHSAKSKNAGECEFLAIVFSETFLSEHNYGVFYSNYIYPVLKGSHKFQEHLDDSAKWQIHVTDLLSSINEMTHEQPGTCELLLKSRLLETWHYCFHNPAKCLPDADTDEVRRLAPVLNYIHENYSYEMTLGELASILPMSEGQFCRIFKKQMQMPPVAYVVWYRILQSCRLLTESDQKIAEVANRTGFNNVSYFNKIFRTSIGCTPTQYREGAHNNSFNASSN
jgi:AraC-like DNA-binding protein/mannose-6-phosphate isomerase-like protein (cupin superfamily)